MESSANTENNTSKLEEGNCQLKSKIKYREGHQRHSKRADYNC